MPKFETPIQFIKYRVLEEVARNIENDTLLQNLYKMPRAIVPGSEAKMRCCVHKERAILNERIQLALGGDVDNPNVLEVIPLACDECPVGGHEVTNACRGCMAKRCEEVCPRDAIWFDKNQYAHIDKDKCIECGRCLKSCPFDAIRNEERPCIRSCKMNAISTRKEDKIATIDEDKCIACGACIVQCPFGAIQDKSWLPKVIELLKTKQEDTPVYAIVAPAIATQFSYASIGQVIAGIKELGFTAVSEVARGADMVAWNEAEELTEEDWITSSCCPAFVDYIHKFFPEIEDHISHNLSPMAQMGQYLKTVEPNAKVVFIGPCTAKKAEAQKESVKPYIDYVLTFEELQAWFGARNITIEDLDVLAMDEASCYGRGFAHSGGVTAAIQEVLKEKGSECILTPIACDGIEECKMALSKAKGGKLNANFIEGMACVGGCIGGASSLSHAMTPKTKNILIKHANIASITDVKKALPKEMISE